MCSPFSDARVPYGRWKSRAELLIAVIRLTGFDYVVIMSLEQAISTMYSMGCCYYILIPTHSILEEQTFSSVIMYVIL